MVESALIDEVSADKMQAVLLDIQQLFYSLCKRKDGPNAGKIDLLGFEEGKSYFYNHELVMRKSRQFMQTDKLSSQDYFRLVDSDQDNLVSFSDFIAPLLAIIPP